MRRDVEGPIDEFDTLRLPLDEVATISARRIDWYRTGLVGGLSMAAIVAVALSRHASGGSSVGGPRPAASLRVRSSSARRRREWPRPRGPRRSRRPPGPRDRSPRGGGPGPPWPGRARARSRRRRRAAATGSPRRARGVKASEACSRRSGRSRPVCHARTAGGGSGGAAAGPAVAAAGESPARRRAPCRPAVPCVPSDPPAASRSGRGAPRAKASPGWPAVSEIESLAAARLAAHPWPAPALAALDRLRADGHQAYLVGGTLRDVLLGRAGAELLDVATDRRPEEVMALFPRVEPIGLAHGTVLVLCEGLGFECTTFRREGAYADARHPDDVEFTTDLRADLARRDFTVNALAFDPLSGVLVDPHGGLADLERRLPAGGGRAAGALPRGRAAPGAGGAIRGHPGAGARARHARGARRSGGPRAAGGGGAGARGAREADGGAAALGGARAAARGRAAGALDAGARALPRRAAEPLARVRRLHALAGDLRSRAGGEARGALGRAAARHRQARHARRAPGRWDVLRPPERGRGARRPPARAAALPGRAARGDRPPGARAHVRLPRASGATRRCAAGCAAWGRTRSRTCSTCASRTCWATA